MKNSRLLTFTCYASFLALGMSSTVLGPTFQSLTARFRMPLQDAGIFTALSFIGATLSAPIYGRLLDRIDVRFVLCGGTALTGGGLLLLGAAPTLPVGLLATLLSGLGAGALIVAPNLVIVALNPGNAAGALNFLNVFFGVGAIAGPQLVNWALSQNNFMLAFRAAAIFMLMLVIPFALASLHLQQGDRGQSQPSVLWISLLPFAALSFIYVGTETGFGSWIFTQLTKISHANEATATIATSMFYAGLTGGRLLASLVSHRLAEKQLLTGAFAILGGGLVLLLGTPLIPTLSLISAFVVGIGCGPVSPTIMALATNAYPLARGTALGMTSAMGSVGGAVLTWLQGQIGGGQSGGMIVPLISTCIMLAIVMTFKVRPTLATPEAKP